ncbi:WD repeat-containing protein on Y chromosome-like [Pelobates fuscus]|uniref:WD repeat-containing protein on Y chromosome-like n=1 Tax=Pelobates fuscus TaxID=191477 RepID=UPI002FE476E4
MPLPPLLQKRAHALQRQLLSESLLQELEVFLKRQGNQKPEKRHLSFSSEENILSFDQHENIRLEEKFRLDDLYALEEVFAKHNLKEAETDDAGGTQKTSLNRRKPKETVQREGNLTLREFQNVLSDLFGSEYWDDHMQLLFNKVDTSCDGYVDWSEFCTYMLLQYKEKDYIVARKTTFLGPPVIKFCLRNKQEPTSRILAITHPPPLWFVSVSKGGVLTVWSSDLHPQRNYEITSDSHDAQSGKRRFKSWTTDAVYMSNVHKIAVATTSRDIHFFDVSTMNMFEEFHLYGLSHVPTCFGYWYNVKSPGERSLLIWGDDSGGINLLRLLKPNSGVFERPFTQQPGPHKIYMQDLKDHSSLLSYQAIPNVHPEAITKLQYIPKQELLITSAGSSTSSIVIMDIHQKGKVYTWNISKGVRCFDYSKTMNLLVTGGLDHKVRLWNQYVPSRPIAVLPEHTMAILDVAIYEPLRQIFSYSKDSVLKVWDIFSHSCLQTLVLKFPCVQPGRIHEQGNFPFLLVPKTTPQLLVSYSDYIGMLRLAQADPEEDTLVTHDAPLSSVLYNSFFHQVITSSEDSTIAVWDVETGTKCLLLNNVHGSEEITCMSFDRSQRKLITGARNGTLKVWNIQNGHNLHRLQPVDEAEITCVLPLRDHTLLSVGWNRKIVVYDVSNMENMYVSADVSWRGGHPHKEDILTADFCSSLGLLVTASFDGEIIVWNVETQRVYLYLRKCPYSRSQPPVDKVLFLHHRATLKDAAILISSEAGTLRWWSIFSHQSKFGYFYVPNQMDDSVFALSSNEVNSVLVSGDTSGFIQVWDISQYALQATDQLQEERPPLLFSWKAHDSTVVNVESFLLDSEHFIASGSSDQTAKLWTQNGKCVGTFGQSKTWNLRNPSTYQYCTTEDSENKQRRDLLTGKQLHRRDEGGGRTFHNEIEEESLAILTKSIPEKLEQGGVPPTDIANVDASLNSEAFSGRGLQKELSKKIISKKERRLLNTEIDFNKCNRFGKLCSPFQALATSEVQEFTLPRNLPLRMRSNSGVGTEGPDWAFSQGANPGKSRKTSQTSQVKTTLLPELDKLSRLNVV